LFSSLADKLVGSIVGGSIGGNVMRETLIKREIEDDTVTTLESLLPLALAEDEKEWTELTTGKSTWNFSRDHIRKIVARSRLMYLVNPLIHRAVTVQELYVWGSGVSIDAEDPTVEEVVEDFLDNPKNQRVIGESWAEREQQQRIDGNTFFIFFRNKRTGAARVRILPLDEVEDILFNPDDTKEPQYYIRSAKSGEYGSLYPGTVAENDRKRVAFPDVDYEPRSRPASLKDGTPIDWESPVMHIKTGGLTGMKFGLPELYSALNWATGYKNILENFATILAAYAQMVMKITKAAGSKGRAAAKSRMNTLLNRSGGTDSNPPKQIGSTFVSSGDLDIQPIKTSNSTTAPDEARALRSMVASGSDTPEHFFGDSDLGNFATSETLDRPTELKMVSRQRMWMFIILRMCALVIRWSATAPLGKLRQAGFTTKNLVDPFDDSRTVTVTHPQGNSVKMIVAFPSILERDVTDRVRSVVQAATLGGHTAEGIFPNRKTLFKYLLIALGEKDVERIADQEYPDDVVQGFADPADKVKQEDLAAQGKADLGDAALQQAAAAKIAARKPAPKSGSPIAGVTNR
jgi:hypothetical protein